MLARTLNLRLGKDSDAATGSSLRLDHYA